VTTHLKVTVPGFPTPVPLCDSINRKLVQAPIDCDCVDCLEIAQEILGIPSDSPQPIENLFHRIVSSVLVARFVRRSEP
jgi:hypothetical protein